MRPKPLGINVDLPKNITEQKQNMLDCSCYIYTGIGIFIGHFIMVVTCIQPRISERFRKILTFFFQEKKTSNLKNKKQKTLIYLKRQIIKVLGTEYNGPKQNGLDNKVIN
ncbi:hypothetical protein HAX54_002235 [Datura stramonium]|uniref:Uncharacterized protein n=1 Tax=Datura stramonium TaxID=4076 RepID=A0ABS8T3K3_DATST|nr:hypothetical protein [Datura stramonium]